MGIGEQVFDDSCKKLDRTVGIGGYDLVPHFSFKGVGLGFSVPPATIKFDIESLDSQSPRLSKGAHGDEELWHFREFAPTAEHTASIAVRTDRAQEPALEILHIDLLLQHV